MSLIGSKPLRTTKNRIDKLKTKNRIGIITKICPAQKQLEFHWPLNLRQSKFTPGNPKQLSHRFNRETNTTASTSRKSSFFLLFCFFCFLKPRFRVQKLHRFPNEIDVSSIPNRFCAQIVSKPSAMFLRVL
jgi:hypothetical protein